MNSLQLKFGHLANSQHTDTSIDYTLCDENDKPLLCIEFDGLKDGFNVGTDYGFDGPPDPWRELITGLKLKVAHGSMFPYFVVGYEHFKDLSDNIELTMVDGIIGEVLTSLETHFHAFWVPHGGMTTDTTYDLLVGKSECPAFYHFEQAGFRAVFK